MRSRRWILIFSLITLLQLSDCQWSEIASYYCKNQQFISQNDVGGFNIPLEPKVAQFINCLNPPTSYMTLSSQQPTIVSENLIEFIPGDFISLDLFFQGTWNNGIVNIEVNNFDYSFEYNSNTQPLSNGFCDNIQSSVQTVQFTLSSQSKSQVKLYLTNQTNNGKVSIRNLYISRLSCYPLCSSCSGPENNQCLSCITGSPTKGKCPQCPGDQYLMGKQCSSACDIYYYPTYDKICMQLKTIQIASEVIDPNEIRYSFQLSSMTALPEYNKTSIGFQHGIFTQNSGTYRFVDLSKYQNEIYQVGIRIGISIYNDIPLNQGIEFKINNTYYGSIQQTALGLQLHRTRLYKEEPLTCSNMWLSCKTYTLILYLDIPIYSFQFAALGLYKNSNAGWSLREFDLKLIKCILNCKFCEVELVCQICNDGFYLTSDGNCVNCIEYHQRLDQNQCYSYDDETPYSKFLIKNEYFSQINTPSQTSQYTQLSKNGVNFLKGFDIYYSLWQGQYIFGGQFIWSQAKFKVTHKILYPHHRVTIGFFILYGSNFPSNGQFIYTFETESPLIKKKATANQLNEDGTKSERLNFIHNHSKDTITLYWECEGSNNNVQDAFCGLYGYNVIVHYCQPNCLQCSDSKICTIWDSQVEAKFRTEKACYNNKYYNKQEQKCLTCPASCLTCTSETNCQICQLTYNLYKQRCICLMNQYEANNQCYECPFGCNQCLNASYCVECQIANNRQLQNGQCICLDGYYAVTSTPVCQKCYNQSTCNCPQGTTYDYSLNSCQQCHSKCQTCFRLTMDGCLSCDLNKNRILKGLQCVCLPGYYEDNNICLSCPSIENQSFKQCYKLCKNDTLIWYMLNCESCDPGFKLANGECVPICGDFKIVGYEQCEDGNNDLDDLCFNCQYQCPRDCQTCNSLTQLPCTGVCGDGIVNLNEECDDANNIQFDGCHQCKFQCAQACTNCVKGKCVQCITKRQIKSFSMSSPNCRSQCGDGYIIESDECTKETSSNIDVCQNCRFNCNSYCSNCDYTRGICLGCELPGFKPYSQSCKNICGDGLIVYDPNKFFSEHCDDRNIISNDRCSDQCKFECQDQDICTQCINTRCYTCGFGYYMSDNYDCYSICGDAAKAKEEKCDIKLPYRGCLNCNPKCQNSCLTCSTNGQGCLLCQQGYQRIDNMCYTNCGDGFVTPDEQCDDGNSVFEDGCHQCQRVCTIACSACEQGICYDCHEGFTYFKHQCIKIQDNYHDWRCNDSCLRCSIEGHGCLECKNGFENIDYVCDTICGDDIPISQEQCDDGNLIFEDGCHQCNYFCTDSCAECIQGVCYKCKSNYFYFKHRCFEIVENDDIVWNTNFLFEYFITNEIFSEKPFQNKMQIKLQEFNEQTYNSFGQYTFDMDANYPSLNIEIIVKCQQHKTLISQYNELIFPKGLSSTSYQKYVKYSKEQDKDTIACYSYNNKPHTITYWFQLKKKIEKDEILIIDILDIKDKDKVTISEELKLSTVVQNAKQNLLKITLNNP